MGEQYGFESIDGDFASELIVQATKRNALTEFAHDAPHKLRRSEWRTVFTPAVEAIGLTQALSLGEAAEQGAIKQRGIAKKVAADHNKNLGAHLGFLFLSDLIQPTIHDKLGLSTHFKVPDSTTLSEAHNQLESIRAAELAMIAEKVTTLQANNILIEQITVTFPGIGQAALRAEKLAQSTHQVDRTTAQNIMTGARIAIASFAVYTEENRA